MANTKLSALTALTGATLDNANDLLYVDDVSVTTSKKITAAELRSGMGFKTTVASTTSPDIFATSVGPVVDYTGTNTATSFVAAPQAGGSRTLVCAGAAAFTASANLIIPGFPTGATWTAAANDVVEVTAFTTTRFLLRSPAKGMQLIDSKTASASTALVFTNLSGYAAVLFVLEQVLPDTNAVYLQIRESIDNGATYIATASYDVAIWAVNNSPSSGALTFVGANNMIANGNTLSNAPNIGCSGTVMAVGLDATTKAKYFIMDTAYGGSGGFNERISGMGVNSNSQAINAVQFLMSSGNIASGTISAYGMRKT